MNYYLQQKNQKLSPNSSFSKIYLRLIAGCFVLLCTPFANAQNVNVDFKEVSFEKALRAIAKQADYEVFYTQNLLKEAKPVSLNLKNKPIKESLDLIFKGQSFNYTLTNQTIVVTAKTSKDSQSLNIDVRGRILNTKGALLPGITLQIVGTSKFEVSDLDGNFSFTQVPSDAFIQYSGLNVVRNTISLDGQTSLNIIVKEKVTEMDEIVVTGYKNIKRSHLTGAVVSVDKQALNQNINTDLVSALEGRVAGLMYQKNPFGASSDTPILRGIGTFSSLQVGYSPLLVIDGLPTELTLDEINPYDIESVNVLKDAAAASVYGSRAANGIIVLTTKKGKGKFILNVNADFFMSTRPDIKGLNLASTSDIIDFEQAVYDRERARYTDLASMFDSFGEINDSRIDYYSPLYELNRNLEEGSLSATDFDATIAQWRRNDFVKDYREQVWQNELRQRYNISFSGSSEKLNSYISINYDSSKSRIKYNTNESVNLYAKNTYQVTDWLEATLGINAAIRDAEVTDFDYGSFDIQKRYERITDDAGNLVIAPYVGIRDGFTSSGLINPRVASQIAALDGFNPVSFNVLDALQDGITETNSLKLRTFANLRARLWDGLSLSSQFQYEATRNTNEQYHDVDAYKMRYARNTLTGYNPETDTYTYLDGFSEGGRFKQLSSKASNYSFRNQLDFSKYFDEGKHFVSAITGFEIRETWVPRNLEQLRYGYDPITLGSAVLNTLDLSQDGVPSYIFGGSETLGTISRYQQEVLHRYFSVYSSINYTLLSKYNLTGSYRVDRADLFGVDSKYKNRPLWAVGLGWNISKEQFMKELSWLNLLKLRATHGITGNVDQSTTPYVTATRRNDRLYQSLQYINITDLPNPLLRWEKTETTNLGLDFAVLDNQLRGSIDLYKKYSSDLLATTDLDPTVGALTRRINAGALLNKGIEVSMGYDWFAKGAFKATSNFVLGFNKTSVDKITRAESTASVYVSSPSDYFFEGETYNSLYAYQYGGITNGYPYVLDENGEPSISFDADGNPLSDAVKTITNPEALVNMGSLMPTYNGSFSQRFSYKQFDLNLFFVFSGGNVIRKDVLDLSSDDLINTGIASRYTDAAPNDTRLFVDFAEDMRNYAGIISRQWRNSSVNVLDGDYIKLRNISLAYNLAPDLAQKLNFSSAKFTFQINNLWFWSAAGNAIDPEVYASNTGTRSIPLPKTYLIGLNINL